MNIRRLLLALVAFLLISGCTNGEELNGGQVEETENGASQDEPNISDPNGEQLGENEEETKDEVEEDVKEESEKKDEKEEPKIATPKEAANEIVTAFSEKDMKKVASFVHPSKGVRFSPYAYVDVEDDVVFTAEQVKEAMSEDTVYTWGVFDGKGNPIEKTFAEYYERFIYDEDFANAEEVAVDERLGHGNTLDNTGEVYPEATVVEFYFSGFNPDFAGMDWRSLRLVLEEEDGQWYLVGVVHDEWTI